MTVPAKQEEEKKNRHQTQADPPPAGGRKDRNGVDSRGPHRRGSSRSHRSPLRRGRKEETDGVRVDGRDNKEVPRAEEPGTSSNGGKKRTTVTPNAVDGR